MRFQYQIRAEPVLPLVAVTVAAWQPVLPAQMPRRAVLPPETQVFGPVHVPAAAAPAVPVDAWQPQAPPPGRLLRSAAETQVFGPVVVPPAVTVEQWLYPPQVPGRAPRVVPEGQIALPLLALSVPGPEQWGSAPVLPFTRASRAVEGGPVSPLEVPRPPAPSFDWFQVPPDGVRRMEAPLAWAVMFAGPSMVIAYSSGTEPVLLTRRTPGYAGYRVLD